MHRRFGLALAVALALGPAGAMTAQAVSAVDPSEVRTRIEAQRSSAKVALAEKERACKQAFAVASCIDAARKEQRAVLTGLRNEELALDEAERTAKADRRRKTLLDSEAARNARPAEGAASAARRSTRHAASSAPSGAEASAGAVDRPKAASGVGHTAHRTADEERRKAEFEARTRSAQAHREAVERRNAQRAASGKKVAPLPVPDAASAP
jgi:hypothetical protein